MLYLVVFRQTVQDCVLYYYLSKMSANYKQLVRRHLTKRRTKLQKVRFAVKSHLVAGCCWPIIVIIHLSVTLCIVALRVPIGVESCTML